MGSYNSAVTTTAGQSLIARAIAGNLPCTLTSAKTTAYVVPGSTSLSSLTSLPGIKQSEAITSASVVSNTQVSASVRFNNTDITLNYMINTIGVYAKVQGDSSETLLAVITAIDPDVMPSYSAASPAAYVYDITMSISNASSVNIVVAPTGSPNYSEFNLVKDEVVAARVGSDGVQYSTLEARLNAENTDLKIQLGQGIEDIPQYSTGNYGIAINGNTVAVNNGEFYLTSFGSAYNVYICECEEGDAFILDGKGGSYQARLWGFVASFTSTDTQADVISVCSATDSAAGLDSGVLYAPFGAAWAVFQLKEGTVYKVGKGLDNYVESILSPITEKANKVDELQNSIYSAVPAGYAEYVYGDETETDSGKNSYTNSGTSGGSAYWNGVVLPKYSLVTGISLSSNCTATDFQLFFFDKLWNLLSNTDVLIPTISDHKFELDEPYALPEGGQVLVAFRNLSGTFYYTVLGSASSKEYVRNASTLQNSTIKVCVDILYKVAEEIAFTNSAKTTNVRLDGFTMPKCKNTSGEYSLIGRWFDWTVDGMTKKAVNNGGQSILFRVKGASVINISWGVRRAMTTPPYIAYAIDGAAWVRQSIETQTIALPDTNEHFVWIVLDGINLSASGANRWDGGVICYLDSLSVDAGTMQACEPINKKILFVGDSIVEGVNVLGAADDSTVYSAVNEFSFRTAKKLNAFPLLCGYGGSTSWSGLGWVEYARNGVPVASLEPDIVLIEYGYNDGSVIAGGTRTVQEFIEAYTELIEKLSVMYPGIPVICLIPFKQSLAQYIRQVAAEFNFCYVIETSGYNVTYTDAAHPNVQGATTIAEHLSEDILNLTGKGFFL